MDIWKEERDWLEDKMVREFEKFLHLLGIVGMEAELPACKRHALVEGVLMKKDILKFLADKMDAGHVNDAANYLMANVGGENRFSSIIEDDMPRQEDKNLGEEIRQIWIW